MLHKDKDKEKDKDILLVISHSIIHTRTRNEINFGFSRCHSNKKHYDIHVIK